MHIDYIFFLFLLASVLGFLIETLYCFAIRRRLVSRRGMLYGPFSQIYGFGALLLLCLLPLSRFGLPLLVLGSAILGGLFEALCSAMQEVIFGTVSWDYSHQKGSLFGGRTSLGFMCYWGFLGAVFIHRLHPVTYAFYMGIAPSLKTWLISAFFVLLAIDFLFSLFALQRWRERTKTRVAKSRADVFLDRHFPNERMQKIFPDVRYRKKISG